MIGASAGGFEALKRLVASLPPALDAAIFVVWHMAPDIRGILPQVLNKLNTVPASQAVDSELIQMNHIYVAPPDRHLLLADNRIRITHGPKENRFRPAVDPLFRSAAYEYGQRVIGVILSGALDDGSAGLWSVKQWGGLAVVQDPADAEVPSMPENALKAVQVDYKVPIAKMGALLAQLCQEPFVETFHEIDMKENEKTEKEVRIALQDNALEQGVMDLGDLSPYACPECHGVLTELREGNLIRFRCHTGHAFSADSLLSAISAKIEDSLWNAIRGAEEGIMLLNHMGDHFAEVNEPRLAAMYFKKSKEEEDKIQLMRQAILNHEQLSFDRIREELSHTNGHIEP